MTTAEMKSAAMSARASFWRGLCVAGAWHWLCALLIAHAAEYAMLLAAWAVIGHAMFFGRIDEGLLIGSLLLLAGTVPCRALTIWAQGALAVRVGGVLRERMLDGILNLDPESVRHEGAGHFLAQVIEVEMVESLALSGGLLSLLSLVELLGAGIVLGIGSARLELPLLTLWCVLAAGVGWHYWRARDTWSDARLGVSQEMLEAMVGHRTRLAQQPPGEWHTAENRQLVDYVSKSCRMDAHAARLEALIPRGWLLAGLLGLAPAFLSASNPAALAISVAGIVLAWRALRGLTSGLAAVCGAAISWRRIAPIVQAADRREEDVVAAGLAPARMVDETGPVIEARDLAFRYTPGSAPVIEGASLAIRRGERWLVEGRSGGGKSTLVALLAGLRRPTRGLLLSGGLDAMTLGGAGWRGRIGATPQHHENHIFTGTFAFNLLLSRRWPPAADDFREAEAVAREAGLGSLLDRMPGGLMEMLGETGWQLSAGERSRLFVCRALLGGTDLVILDESFAALDPHTLRQSLECSLRRAKSLLVVAHP